MDENIPKPPKMNHPFPGFEDRRAYSEWFIKEYNRPEWREYLQNFFTPEYIDAVLSIYKERLEKNDFNIGPQGKEWEEFQQKYKKGS
jgi:hypothetical protein